MLNIAFYGAIYTTHVRNVQIHLKSTVAPYPNYPHSRAAVKEVRIHEYIFGFLLGGSSSFGVHSIGGFTVIVQKVGPIYNPSHSPSSPSQESSCEGGDPSAAYAWILKSGISQTIPTLITWPRTSSVSLSMCAGTVSLQGNALLCRIIQRYSIYMVGLS